MGTLDGLQLIPALWLGSVVMGLILRLLINAFSRFRRNFPT